MGLSQSLRIAVSVTIFCSCLTFTPGSCEYSNEIPELSRSLNEKEFELFTHLLGPNDTTLQQETKQLLAQYLVAQTLADAEKKQAQAQTQTTASSVTSVSASAASVSASAASVTDRTEPPAIPSIKASTTTPAPTTPRVTVAPEHVLNQVNKIINNAATGNVVGIVDESLKIRAPDPVRNLVGGILQLVFCNPLDRLFNRCRKQEPAPAPAANRAPAQSKTPNIDRLTNRLTGNTGAATPSKTPNIDRLTSRLTGNNNNNRLFG